MAEQILVQLLSQWLIY